MNPIHNFNLKCFLDSANELLRADETIRALNLLDNLPAYYRQNIPQEVQTLRREVMARLATASFYATSSGYELTAPDDSYLHVGGTLRGQLLLKEVKELNAQDLTPHVLDMAPGEYAFVRNLLHNLCTITYQPSFVNWPSYEHYKKHFIEHLYEWKPAEVNRTRPVIYFAGEIIEHLWQEAELRYEMERKVGLADVIHISTPNMTYDYTCTDWRSKGDLGHLRAYTPQEFMNTVSSIFPDYVVQVFVSQILHARCVLRDTKFNIPKEVQI